MMVAVMSTFALFSTLEVFSQVPAKRNVRPAAPKPVENIKPKVAGLEQYDYKFVNPQFYVSNVEIKHDENGIGSLVFRKMDSDEDVKLPLALSDYTLRKLLSLYEKLDFLNSKEKYQSAERDYGHLGTITISLSKEGKQHTDSFNWTENPDAHELSEEYRRILNQEMWIFDFNVAKTNQPLETSKILKRLESQVRRNSISDPLAILNVLKEIEIDESIPLIARNQARRIVKKMEADLEKAEKKRKKEAKADRKSNSQNR